MGSAEFDGFLELGSISSHSARRLRKLTDDMARPRLQVPPDDLTLRVKSEAGSTLAMRRHAIVGHVPMRDWRRIRSVHSHFHGVGGWIVTRALRPTASHLSSRKVAWNDRPLGQRSKSEGGTLGAVRQIAVVCRGRWLK